tara:strand:- start:301 stop:579 length:279 start_codon:yes stop_codon:yes gene_type:complete
MDIGDINRLRRHSNISGAYNKALKLIEDHNVILNELIQILEHECEKDPLGDKENAPDVEFIEYLSDTIRVSTETLMTIYAKGSIERWEPGQV